MPNITTVAKISVDEYVKRRFALLKRLSPEAIFRSGYADEFYVFPIIHSKKEVNEFLRIQLVLQKSVKAIVRNYFQDKEIQKRVPLKKEVRKQLQRLSNVPYRIGGIRPDYIYSESGQPFICEINARFIFNAFFMSIYMNEVFEGLFPKYVGMSGITESKKAIQKQFASKKIAVIKEREDGYDIHSFLLEYPGARLFGIKDLKNVIKKYKTIVLELHQDELEKHIKVISGAILAGKEVLNDPRTVFIVHDKRLFSVLSDINIMRKYLSATDAKLLKKYIIPTYSSAVHKSVFSKAAKEKDKWVGKKAISGKSDGLYLGKEKKSTSGRQS